jgi:uncharacterized protein (TIGR00730 family)
MKITNICVYSGGRYDAGAEHFRTASKELGELLAYQGWGLVYGAGGHGLMGTVATSVINHGGRVIGVIPQHIVDQEKPPTYLTELYVVDSMHTRKQKMADLGDAFVILPGGYGTVEEAFEILTWRQLGLHNKPIIFLNIDGFWDPIQAQKQKFYKEGFITENDFKLFKVVTNSSDILEALKDDGYSIKETTKK